MFEVKVDYTGKLENGTVFDTSEGREPLEFEVGTGRVIKGFDDALIGMEKDEEKEVNISSENAYGAHNPELMKKIPKTSLPQGQEPKKDMILLLKTPDGNQFPVKIAEVDDDNATINLNHPLAGKNLVFKIKVVDIVS